MGHLGPTAGVHLKVVRERLGYANIGILLDTYSHLIAGMHEDAAEQVAAMFRTPVSNPLAETTWGAADERSDQRFSLCPRGDLNPHALSRALAPQASASTYSATRTCGCTSRGAHEL
jgi:hypothetical protein